MRVFKLVLKIIGIISILCINIIEVVPRRRFCYETGVRLVDSPQVLYYFDHLVIAAHYVELLVVLLEHFFAGREREARRTGEEYSIKFALIPFLIAFCHVE